MNELGSRVDEVCTSFSREMRDRASQYLALHFSPIYEGGLEALIRANELKNSLWLTLAPTVEGVETRNHLTHQVVRLDHLDSLCLLYSGR